MSDRFTRHTPGLTSPGSEIVPVTADDATDLLEDISPIRRKIGGKRQKLRTQTIRSGGQYCENRKENDALRHTVRNTLVPQAPDYWDEHEAGNAGECQRHENVSTEHDRCNDQRRRYESSREIF